MGATAGRRPFTCRRAPASALVGALLGCAACSAGATDAPAAPQPTAAASAAAAAVPVQGRGLAPRRQKPLALTLIDSRVLPHNASGVAVDGSSVIIVDDDHGLLLLRPGAPATLLPSAGADGLALAALHDLEGVTRSADGATLYAVAEETGMVVAVPWPAASLSLAAQAPRVVLQVPRVGSTPNKGFEGIALLPRGLAGNATDVFVLVNEDKPRAVVLASLVPGAVPVHLKLPAEAKDLLPDLSDVAVDPTNGHLLVLSDRGACVAELALDHDALALVGSFPLPLENGEKPEGITFDGATRVVVVTDGSARMLTFAVVRRE